ncbi:MAG: replication-associated recombination protein A [Methylocystaceae bacterium]
MSDLFMQHNEESKEKHGPLAFRMRPGNLDEFAGQQHLLGPGAPLRRLVEEDRLHSLVLYGPPGTGKTSLAHLIARSTRSFFATLSAVSSGVSDLKAAARSASERLAYDGQRTILFVDEIHRFNKAQQDVLLPYIEDGTLTLIGATTENPLYEINSALLSRMRVYMLEPLDESDLTKLIRRALTDQERGLALPAEALNADAENAIITAAKGDARAALTILEMADSLRGNAPLIDQSLIEKVTGRVITYYDKKGDAHYDTISAYIKSIRGSDPDAALYWLAVMLEGGEDPMFIARRLVIHAAEDIGLADPLALLVCEAAASATHLIGMPEARIPLAEATIYLACAPKSNSAKAAIDEAIAAVRRAPMISVPNHLADTSHSKAGKILGHGVGYKYPPDFGGYVKQDYLPDQAQGLQFYHPSDNGKEKQIARFLADLASYLKS